MASNKKQVEDVLRLFGLSDAESQVYQSVLATGPAKASAIAVQAGLKRVFTYNTLLQLLEQGIVQEFVKRGVRHFEAAPPKTLLDIVDNREKDLQYTRERLSNAIPMLEKIENNSSIRSGVRYYEGLNGVKSVFTQMLETVEEGDTIYGLTDEKYAGFINNELRNWMDSFVENRVKQGIKWRGIANKSAESDKTLKHDPSQSREIKQIEGVNLIASFHIYSDNVAITITKDKPMAIVIENRDIAETARSLFAAYWELLPDYE